MRKEGGQPGSLRPWKRQQEEAGGGSAADAGRMSRWWGAAAALTVTFCTASALYILHQEAASFDGALSTCLAEGSLTSMASEEEKDRVLTSVSASLKSAGSFHFWVGLRKPAGSCDREDLPLRGFVWTSGDGSESGVSRWKRTPIGTCTSERCGLLSLDFAGGTVTDWGWSDSSCAKQHGFICKSRAAEPLLPDLPGNGSPCAAGSTPCSRPQPSSEAPRVHTTRPVPLPPLSLQPEGQGAPTPSSAPGPTTNSGVVTHIRDGTLDKYNVFIPVLVALLVLVILVVVVLSVLKCCFRKRPKDPHGNGEGGKPEETVDLTATDLDRNETTA